MKLHNALTKCVIFIDLKTELKEPILHIWKGESALEKNPQNLAGDWTDSLSFTFKLDLSGCLFSASHELLTAQGF